MNKALSRGAVSAAKGHILIEMQHLNSLPLQLQKALSHWAGWKKKNLS